jgi:hypothetical protein
MMRWPKYAVSSPDEPECICPFVDVGVGPLMRHGVDPDCPVCNPEPHLACSCQHWGWLVKFTYGDAREGDEIDVECPLHGA